LGALPTSSIELIAGIWSPAVNNIATTTYTFTPTDLVCNNTTTMIIMVTPNVTPTFTPVAAVCSGASLSLPTSSIELITGTWSPALNNLATTTYTFTPDAGLCATTATMSITVNDLPDFTISNGCDGVNYVLSTLVTNGATPTYIWYDALHQPIGTSSSITITDEADYSVAVSINGCSEEKSITISNSYCSIPKGISPNGDGDNDFFDLSELNVQNLQIFNRYGIEVYSKSDYKKEWNGKTNAGKELSDGTYYYIVNFVTGKTKTGWVYINK
jgi:gliding motility-associated-like protein